jgi:hypothetical protein
MENKYVVKPIQAQNDISYLLKKVVETVKESEISYKIDLLLLGGGFGRGEGSVILKNEHYVTANDIDLFVITRSSISNKEKKELKKKLEDQFELKDCGIDVLDLNKLYNHAKKGKLQQDVFDLLKGHIILWENCKDFEIASEFEKIINKKYLIKMSSAYDVLRTRMWCIVAPIDFEEEKLCVDKNYKSEIFAYFQIAKAATAIIDSILIADSVYITPSFAVKLEQFKSTMFYKENDAEVLVKLVRRKIYNQDPICLQSDTIEKIVYLYCKAIEYVIKRNKVSYLGYLLWDKLRLLYVRKMKNLYIDKNYKLEIAKLLQNPVNNKDRILTIQSVMRKKY